MTIEALTSRISTLVSLMEALGAIIFLYLIFGVVNILINRKRLKELENINKNVVALKKVMSKKK